jgi:hypothetical protein
LDKSERDITRPSKKNIQKKQKEIGWHYTWIQRKLT